MKKTIFSLNKKVFLNFLKKLYFFILNKYKIIIFIFLSILLVFLFFSILKYKKEIKTLQENNTKLQLDNNKPNEVVLPSKDDLRLKYNYINREDYPYYFSVDNEWKLDSSYGNIKVSALSLVFEHKKQFDYEDKFYVTNEHIFLVFTSRDNEDLKFIDDSLKAMSIENVEFRDIDNDKEEELLVYSYVANKVYGLKIYKANFDTCDFYDNSEKCIKSFSKMNNLELFGRYQIRIDNEGYFIVKNEKSFDSYNGGRIGTEVIIEKYLIQNNSFKLVSTESVFYKDDNIKYFTDFEEKDNIIQPKNEVNEKKESRFIASYDDLGRIISFSGDSLDFNYEYSYFYGRSDKKIKKIRFISNFDKDYKRYVREIKFDIDGKKIKEEIYSESL